MISFTMGPVSSGKTVELVVIAHQLTTIYGKSSVKVVKPAFDTRFGSDVIKSASGLEVRITDLITEGMDFNMLNYDGVRFIVLDEVQFFTVDQIYQLRDISSTRDIDIYCFGLLKDFRNEMFVSTKAMLEIADKIVQKNTFCILCKPEDATRSANISMKICKDESGNIMPSLEGASAAVGGIETYVPVCSRCFYGVTRPTEFNVI